MYVGTLALYAYGAGLRGEPDLRLLRIFLALLVLVNLEDVRASGTTEDLMVYTKLAVLGLFRADFSRFSPPFDHGPWRSF